MRAQQATGMEKPKVNRKLLSTYLNYIYVQIH